MPAKTIKQEQLPRILEEHKAGLDSGWRHGQLADFQKMDLRGISFKGANLKEADFSGANLQEVNFSGSDLEGVIFDHANLYKANLRFCNLKFANFEATDVRDAKTFWIKIRAIDRQGAIGSSLSRGALGKKITTLLLIAGAIFGVLDAFSLTDIINTSLTQP